MDDAKLEFWGDMQKTLFVENTAVAMLSDSQLEGLISEDGRKAHRPIISLPHSGTYTPYSDITFNRKTASKQTLEVDTFSYAADEIDITDSRQTKYPLTENSAMEQMKVHNNNIEQAVMSKITGAFNLIDDNGNALLIDTTNVLDVFEQADTKLGSVDAPFENRIAVFGPHTIATMRKAKQQRESVLGDSVLANGVVGPWSGYTVIQSNNLPWSATLTLSVNPTTTDKFYIAGVGFQFIADLANTASGFIGVLIGNDAAASRVNLKKAVDADAASKGTLWKENTSSTAAHNRFTLTEKRKITCTTAEAMAFTGFGDIVVSEAFTSASNVWSAQEQLAFMGNKGAIDLVLQIMEIDVKKLGKEKGFADLVKSLVGHGSYMFDDGARVSVKVRTDASAWK